MELNTLNSKITKPKKRLGRGIGSSKGKTSGRGHKGQKSRSGVAIKSFEGGQMPLYRRLPKRGFKSINREVIETVNFLEINRALHAGKLDAAAPITKEHLHKAGLIRRLSHPVKLLNKGDTAQKLTLHVDFASASALEAVKGQGGTVAMRDIVRDLATFQCARRESGWKSEDGDARTDGEGHA